jgi:hypothetical protein
VVNANLSQGSVIVACDENPKRGSSRRVHNDGMALEMAHSLEARGLDERVAEIDYRKSSQPERARRKRHGNLKIWAVPRIVLTSVFLARQKAGSPSQKNKSKRTKKTLLLHF